MSSIYPDSTNPSFVGAKAVDGIYEDESSLAHTLRETNPWLKIDLENSATVYAVNILNRGLNCMCDLNSSLLK